MSRDSQEPISTAPFQGLDVIEALRKKSEALEKSNARAMVRIQKLEIELDAARAQVAWFHRQLFGQKAERVPTKDLEAAFRQYVAEQEARANNEAGTPLPLLETELSSIQLLMDFAVPDSSVHPKENKEQVDHPQANETQEDTVVPPVSQPPSAPPSPPPKKKGHGRRRIPATLREEAIVIQPDEIPEGARQVGADVSYRVGIRRPELVRFAIVRPKYAVDHIQEATTDIIVADPPHEMVPRGLFAPSGLAHIIAGRHDRSIPYHRLNRFFESADYPMAVSTLSGVAIRAVPLARDLVEAMQLYAQQVAPYLAIDATGVLLQSPEACLRGHVWLRYIENTCVLVSFTKTHDAQSAGVQLDGWSCPILADGAQVYDAKLRETENERAGCWSHGRRKFVYAAPTDGRALVGVQLINQLFAIEREVLHTEAEHRLPVRIERSAPIIDELFRWRDDLLAHGNLGRSMLAKALRYLKNQAQRLTYFLKDGRVPIHNNLTELQARHLAIGRNNWLFFGSLAGAEASCVWLSLVLSARMHRLDVERYLRDLFRVLPLWPKTRILELAPHRWKETRARLDPLEMSRELGNLTIPPQIS